MFQNQRGASSRAMSGGAESMQNHDPTNLWPAHHLSDTGCDDARTIIFSSRDLLQQEMLRMYRISAECLISPGV